MSERADEGGGEAVAFSAARPWWLPAMVGVVGAAVAIEGLGLPLFEDYAALGPGFLTLVVGVAILTLAAAMAIQLARGIVYEAEAAEGADANAAISWLGFLTAAAAVFMPVALIGLIGFPAAAGLSYALVARAFGSLRLAVDIAIGICVAALTWLAFSKLGVDLGPFVPRIGGK